jgi:hypothetical protein
MNTHNQVVAAKIIAAEATWQVAYKYGDGRPGSEASEAPLAYHNLRHTFAVRRGTRMMCQALGMSVLDTALADAEAASHDVVQLGPRGVMEYESGRWLQDSMHRMKTFTDTQIEEAPTSIEATGIVTANGVIVGQAADYIDYRTHASELRAKSVGSADFGQMYMPEGPLLSHEIYREAMGDAPGEVPALDGLVAFQRSSVALNDGYRYPHAVGELLFGGLRREVIAHQERVLRGLERGTMETFAEVIAHDQLFLQQHY